MALGVASQRQRARLICQGSRQWTAARFGRLNAKLCKLCSWGGLAHSCRCLPAPPNPAGAGQGGQAVGRRLWPAAGRRVAGAARAALGRRAHGQRRAGRGHAKGGQALSLRAFAQGTRRAGPWTAAHRTRARQRRPGSETAHRAGVADAGVCVYSRRRQGGAASLRAFLYRLPARGTSFWFGSDPSSHTFDTLLFFRLDCSLPRTALARTAQPDSGGD